ncbi:hypothetical protein GUH12_01100, partial [Xanthomonas citri pv. citri]|nr:hypothetical protein [Xanthomonas citri pv. citri]
MRKLDLVPSLRRFPTRTQHDTGHGLAFLREIFHAFLLDLGQEPVKHVLWRTHGRPNPIGRHEKVLHISGIEPLFDLKRLLLAH